MINTLITHHLRHSETNIVLHVGLSEVNVLSEEELGAIAGARIWGRMILGRLQEVVYTGPGATAQAACLRQSIGSAGVGGMLAGALQGGQRH
ncbi:hypothetical protein [Burkholderia guangdongensis]|uniref:hypothetical protein n=1 Tax=Burkholderia guangdongensis TaxID=1792500 RepID=UPI0015C7C5D7|nr:hypothetical protein [Burkholderia guangdongensis]